MLPPAWLGAWLGSVSALQATTGSNATLWTASRIIGTDGPTIGAAAALLAIAAWALWHRAVHPPLPLAIAGALPISLAIAPHGWSYDQLVLIVPVVVLFGALSGSGRRRTIVLLSLAAVTLPWALYMIAFRRGGEELTVVTPLLLFAAVVVMTARQVPSGPPAMEKDPDPA